MVPDQRPVISWQKTKTGEQSTITAKISFFIGVWVWVNPTTPDGDVYLILGDFFLIYFIFKFCFPQSGLFYFLLPGNFSLHGVGDKAKFTGKNSAPVYLGSNAKNYPFTIYLLAKGTLAKKVAPV